MKPALRDMIDRMVADSIRRILPAVMNEVLLKTIAGSGVLAESAAPVRRKAPKPPKRGKPAPAKRAAPVQQKPMSKRKINESLQGLLDEQAGAEFYNDPYGAMQESAPDEEYDVEVDDGNDYEIPQAKSASRNPIKHLAPALQGLAEGMSIGDDDEDGMWDGGLGDSATPSPTMGPPIDKAVQAMGSFGAPLDFNRMKGMVRQAPKKAIDADDRRANAQFEVARIKRMREQLNGGKPIE